MPFNFGGPEIIILTVIAVMAYLTFLFLRFLWRGLFPPQSH
jgi:hypothetical protein